MVVERANFDKLVRAARREGYAHGYGIALDEAEAAVRSVRHQGDVSDDVSEELSSLTEPVDVIGVLTRDALVAAPSAEGIESLFQVIDVLQERLDRATERAENLQATVDTLMEAYNVAESQIKEAQEWAAKGCMGCDDLDQFHCNLEAFPMPWWMIPDVAHPEAD
jgi:outer membrane murein-binding lipoprotein Lpp